MTTLGSFCRYFCVVFAICVIAAQPATAAEVVPGDIEAAVRALGFLDSLQRRPSITVAVVYKGGDAESKSTAQRTAGVMNSLQGPNGASISVLVVAVNELAQMPPRMDAIYLVPGAADQGRAVADYARRQHVVTVSSDPACLDAQCCALMVRAAARTEIVLDTAVAHETGASFSSVFMMMVKRR